MTMIIELFAVLVSSAAFSIGFNIRGKHLFYAVVGGAVSWAVYFFTSGLFETDIPSYLLAAAAISLYCEIVARVNKTPVTVYLVVGIIPLVPGWLIYRTMLSFIQADQSVFIERLMYTVSIAGAIALGVVAVSSIFRLFVGKLKNI